MKKYIFLIILACIGLAGYAAYYAWSEHKRQKLEHTAMGDDVIAAREAVIGLAGINDKRSIEALIKVLNTQTDKSVVDSARLLLLRSNNMMPSKPFPDYTYTLEEPVFTVKGEVLILKHGDIPEWIIEMYCKAVKERLRINVRVEECPFDFKDSRSST